MILSGGTPDKHIELVWESPIHLGVSTLSVDSSRMLRVPQSSLVYGIIYICIMRGSLCCVSTVGYTRQYYYYNRILLDESVISFSLLDQ